jgi:hypothetical protein
MAETEAGAPALEAAEQGLHEASQAELEAAPILERVG